MAFQLLIARGNGEGQQFVVVQSVVLIGRDEDNDVVLSDAGVSRQHTRIFEKQGRYWAEDLGSSGGTLINGQKVLVPRELKSGDALAIGAALINFVELDDGRPKAMPAAPVTGKVITGDNPIPGARPGMLSPPPVHQVTDQEIITASGEQRAPWDGTGEKKQLWAPDTEVTAPVGRPLVFEDSTVPAGKPLKVDPSTPLGTGLDTELGVPRQIAPEMKIGPALVPASSLKRSFDASEQKTTTALPDGEGPLGSVRDPVFEGPTQIKAPAPLALADSGPSFNKLLRDDAKPLATSDRMLHDAATAPVPKEEDSLAPLDLSRSDLQSLQQLVDPTRADAKPLVDESTGEGQALSPRVTYPLIKGSAAERSRRRRLRGESLGAQAAAWWSDLPLKTRAIVAAACGLIVSGAIIGLVQFLRPEEGPPLPTEPDRLPVSHERVRYFFGLGEGVEYPRPDGKEFTFDFVTPTDAAILIHYQAQEIDRDEVAIIVNGTDVGFVPPDIGVPDREIETLVPQRVLKRGEKNTVVFDNVRNPPGKDRWRVGELWLELLPVPPATAPEAIRRAKDLAKQAGQLYAQRDVGSDNVFRSWKAYRLAWQVLLVVPEEQRGTLFEQTRRKSEELAQELDRQCGALMLDAKKQMELKNPDRAKEILDSVSLSFPTNEHRCHQLANERLDEYQL